MTKYEIYTDWTEINGGGYDYTRYGLSAADIFGMYDMETDHVPTLEASFDTLDEAKAAFEKAFRGYGMTRQGSGHDIDIRVAWVEETEYDDDGEFIAAHNVDIFDAAPLPATVEYGGGESRNSDKAVDYMLAQVRNDRGFICELYAEADPIDGDETGTFEALKAEILKQAAENGLTADALTFED